ncbi:phosphoribosylglycinamide formyltransferase [Phosphitispora sp. TUW77]|uniref:phosphoribosylglycinamide formyltransferase n=1 Tax=Phosphitispora sp. TUW77 TaxID=3152361 RepID=UPI003AB60995
MSKLRLGVLASGRGSNLQAIIDNIAANKLDAEVAVVISDNPDAFALERARNHRIPAVHIKPGDYREKEEYEKAVIDCLRENRAELVVLAGYMRLVGKVLLDEYPNRIMNIHPALLPSFPGLHGQRDAVAYGVKYSGCTIHFVDEGMDTGPIILQEVVPVLQDDDEDSLAARILKEEHKLYSKAIQLFAEGKLRIEGRKIIII